MKQIKKILKYLYMFTLLFLSVYLIKQSINVNLLPNKYLIILIVSISIIDILSFVLMTRKHIIAKVIGIILSLLIIVASIIGTNYLNDTINFFNKAFNNNTIEITKYDVIVLNNSKKDDLLSLNNSTIGYLKEDQENNKILSYIDTIDFTKTENEDLYELYNLLLNKKVNAIILDDAMYDLLADDYKTLFDDTKIVYTFEIETKIEITKEDSELRPINIYISGSDSRANTIYNKSRSDVNLILTVNPYTHEILTTTIPRDYYVQVHGQTGLKDKLTHAGIYGLSTSEATLEDLLDIKIDYSVKINFNAVVEVVDLVGGVNIYSDTEFNSYHYKGWKVEKGYNYMDGAHALAYSRERYAYASGDRHRGQNQQQVLEAVLTKIMSDKSLLLQYEDLLTSLSNLYRTTIPKETISVLVKEQLNTMSKWQFESISVSGSNAMLPTHTAPNSKRYVMIPYEKDIQMAHNKITSLQNKK